MYTILIVVRVYKNFRVKDFYDFIKFIIVGNLKNSFYDFPNCLLSEKENYRKSPKPLF